MKYLIFFLFAVFALVSCTEENITNYAYKRTLVLITDHEPSTDVILAIKGDVRANFKDVELVVYQTKKFDTYDAAYLLQTAYNYFPSDAYFCVIADPGNGDKKFYSEYQGRKIIAPDNGITSILTKNQNLKNAFYLDDIKNFPEYSKLEDVPYMTLYRKAVMKMLSGDQPSSYGSPVENLKSLEVQDPVNINGVLSGQVVFVDNFGNCALNITKSLMTGIENGDYIEIKSGNLTINAKVALSYDAVPKNLNVAIFDDSYRINLAVSFGSFSAKYNINAGDKITITKKNFKVGILRYNDSELSSNIMSDIVSTLANYGLNDDKNITYIVENANSDINKFEGLISKMVDAGIDMIVPISTPASQAAVKYVPSNIPIVYTYVTSPEFAGLIGKRGNITGISDGTNFNDYLSFVKELLPTLNKAGRIYNNQEPNSEYAQQELIKLSSFYNLNYETETIASVDNINQAFNNLKNKNIGAILIAADNTMNVGMKQLAQLCSDNSLPLIGDSEENVTDGALAGISVNYNDLAVTSAETIYSVMLGVDPDSIGIKTLPTSDIAINKKTASKINYTFPQSVINRASLIIE